MFISLKVTITFLLYKVSSNYYNIPEKNKINKPDIYARSFLEKKCQKKQSIFINVKYFKEWIKTYKKTSISYERLLENISTIKYNFSYFLL